MITASALTRVAACPASAALPQGQVAATSDMQRGTIVHAYLEACATMPRDEALARVPTEHVGLCEAIDFGRLPVQLPSPHVRAEEALIYDCSTDTTRSLGRGIDRRYGDVGLYEIPGTPDLWWQDGDAVCVVDWKVGYGSDLYAPPPERNLQLQTGALAAARLVGASEARIARCRIDEDGEVRTDRWHTLDSLDLDIAAASLRNLIQHVGRLRERVEMGRAVDTRAGEHCRYCPAWESCPSKTGLIRALAIAPADEEASIIAALTPETAAAARTRAQEIRRVLERVESAIDEYARRVGGIPVAEGVVYGPVQVDRESIDGALAYGVIEEMFGREVADAVIIPTATKSRIKEALRPLAKERGAKLAHLERDVLGALREAGAVTVTTAEQMKEHRE